jgi:hypothetical protein
MKIDEKGIHGELFLTETKKIQAGRVAIAAWVTRIGRMEPFQAVGGWLTK